MLGEPEGEALSCQAPRAARPRTPPGTGQQDEQKTHVTF